MPTPSAASAARFAGTLTAKNGSSDAPAATSATTQSTLTSWRTRSAVATRPNRISVISPTAKVCWIACSSSAPPAITVPSTSVSLKPVTAANAVAQATPVAVSTIRNPMRLRMNAARSVGARSATSRTPIVVRPTSVNPPASATSAVIVT